MECHTGFERCSILVNDYQIVVTKKGEQNFTEGSSGNMWWKLVGEIWLCTWIAGTIEGAGDVGFFQSSQTDTNGTLFEALKFVGLMINDVSKWKNKFLNRISEISRTKRRKRRKQNRRDAHRPPGLFSRVMLVLGRVDRETTVCLILFGWFKEDKKLPTSRVSLTKANIYFSDIT